LLDEILFRARAASVREIFLEVRPSNQTALALYRKKGFHQVSNRPAYYQAQAGREDAAVLVKKLVMES
jgi:ribosomal-protein-alanine N-acetyltransferase